MMKREVCTEYVAALAVSTGESGESNTAHAATIAVMSFGFKSLNSFRPIFRRISTSSPLKDDSQTKLDPSISGIWINGVF